MPLRPSTRPSRRFFDDGSPYLRHPLLTAERTEIEAGRIESALGVGPGADLLDVGCGFGRHCLALAGRGHRMTGIDSSPAMIRVAIDAAAEAGFTPGHDIEFTVGDGRTLPADPTYDGALAMFTTVGQVDAAGVDNVTMLTGIGAVLRPGATFLIEVPQREWAVANLAETDRFGQAATLTVVERRYQPELRRVIERFVVGEPGREVAYDLAYRLFDPDELADLLVEAGFTSLVVTGSLAGLADGSAPPIGPDDPTIYIAAARR